MEAKDTVLKIEDWKQFDLEAHKRANQLAQDTEGSFNSADIEAIYEAAEIAKLERQAEISFKAGIKEVVDNPKYFIDMEAHKRGDTDDLIMWGWEQAANSKEGQVVLIAVPKEKLKEWGIE